ncbi:hypothetical protein Btru_070731 [Bulinus truncatus]|nr:hypothetical protein Btru_070731 [Bulinus truncatus]
MLVCPMGVVVHNMLVRPKGSCGPQHAGMPQGSCGPQHAGVLPRVVWSTTICLHLMGSCGPQHAGMPQGSWSTACWFAPRGRGPQHCFAPWGSRGPQHAGKPQWSWTQHTTYWYALDYKTAKMFWTEVKIWLVGEENSLGLMPGLFDPLIGPHLLGRMVSNCESIHTNRLTDGSARGSSSIRTSEVLKGFESSGDLTGCGMSKMAERVMGTVTKKSQN